MMEEESQDLVPDALLAFAKDHRYIRQCRELLQSVFQQEDSDGSDLWWLSALLYATLVLGRKGRTLGMEFMGLEHVKLSPWQRRTGMVALAAGWALWSRQCIRLERSQQEEQRHEALRGAARRYFHQQQRHAMLQRAARTTTVESLSLQSYSPPARTASEERASSGLAKRIRKRLLRFTEIMSEAIAAAVDNPHALPNTATVLTMGRWILRLHLAHYCFTGRYPTWAHRFWNLSLQRNQATRISDPPTASYPLIGKLILIQVGATLVKSFARWFASYLASKQITSSPEPDESSSPANPQSLQLCGICRMPRTQSAVPSSCGHIFCWKCLYQWVSTVRPECPLCRSACRPQDILALYNYAPS